MNRPPKTPLLAVDMCFVRDGKILLIKRKNPPHGWALPGGFVDVGETCEDAAVREMKEETSLNVFVDTFFRLYDRPDRDPRGHTVSLVYWVRQLLSGDPVAKDDATEVEFFFVRHLPEMAFDHRQIVEEFWHEFYSDC